MDILNFISWIKGGRVVTTVPPSQTLIPVGLKDGRRDDEYLAGAITYQDLAAQLALTQSCKIIINGTGGLSNTQNGVDFLVLYNTIAWNESLNDFTPTGSKIRITSTDSIEKYKCDYIIITAWNYLRIILRKEINYLKKGGRFILPIPQPKIISIKNYKNFL